jgi:hypothetical protein
VSWVDNAGVVLTLDPATTNDVMDSGSSGHAPFLMSALGEMTPLIGAAANQAPEPNTLGLLGLGLVGFAISRRRKYSH